MKHIHYRTGFALLFQSHQRRGARDQYVGLVKEVLLSQTRGNNSSIKFFKLGEDVQSASSW